MGGFAPLPVDVEELLRRIEERCGVSLPRPVKEVGYEPSLDLLFIRFRDPEGIELGEPLCTRAIAAVFRDEKGVTALEVAELRELLEELFPPKAGARRA
jgi:hypothetical protein